MAKCPVCGMMVDENSSPSTEYKGKTYYFMSPAHQKIFETDPEKILSQQSDSSGMSDMSEGHM